MSYCMCFCANFCGAKFVFVLFQMLFAALPKGKLQNESEAQFDWRKHFNCPHFMLQPLM